MIYFPRYAQSIPGWMSGEELAWLYLRATEMSSVVEIGSWCGRSTYALLSGCSGSVYAVDHFLGSPSELETTHAEALTKDIHAEFMSYVGMFPNLHVLQTNSGTAAAHFPEKSIDMIFIDADHTTEAFSYDLSLWSPICTKLLCGHDRDIPDIANVLDVQNLPYHKGPGSLWYVTLEN